MSERSNKVTASPQESPLYGRIAATLKDEILAGIHPVGGALPTEHELGKRFSVSRHTVREALRCLRDDGMVASRRGAGTVVLPPQRQHADTHQVMSINDLLTFATDARFDIYAMQMVVIDNALADKSGLSKGEEWFVVSGYRHSQSDMQALCWTEYFIHRNFASIGRLLQRHQGPIFPLLEDMFGLTVQEVEQQISATLVAKEIAEGLGVDAGEPALEVRRCYRTADAGVVQVTLNTHPASRFQHRMTIRRVRV